MDLSYLNITTTDKETFTGEESAVMAFLIYKRLGRDLSLSHQKWCALLGNNSSVRDFTKLVQAGQELT